jgi:PhzF family phenazine biosynthesis protein
MRVVVHPVLAFVPHEPMGLPQCIEIGLWFPVSSSLHRGRNETNRWKRLSETKIALVRSFGASLDQSLANLCAMTRYYVVDAFTTVPFEGNGAGVVVCGRQPHGRQKDSVLAPLDSPGAPEAVRVMQQVAAEINLSETAFTWKLTGTVYEIRYFTPTVEIALCGHATLAAAKVLWETGVVPREETIHFRTGEGQELCCDLEGGRVCMVFPGDELDELEAGEEKARLMRALSLHQDDGVSLFKGRLNRDYLVVVPDACFSQLDARLDMREIQEVNEASGVRGVIVTTAAGEREKGQGIDIKSRFFSPNSGIPEDPVTGSSFPTLAAYYVPRLNKRHFVGLQDHPRRKGVVHVRIADDGMTAIGGDAVLVSCNEFLI